MFALMHCPAHDRLLPPYDVQARPQTSDMRFRTCEKWASQIIIKVRLRRPVSQPALREGASEEEMIVMMTEASTGTQAPEAKRSAEVDDDCSLSRQAL